MLATHGSDCTIDGITVPVGTITVNNVSTGYYEFDRWTPQAVLEPIYILDTTIDFEDTDPINYTIHVSAIHTMPTGSIDFPPDGTWIEEGQPVTLEASATGGAPPYTFDWESDVDGYLGSGATLTTSLSVSYVDSEVIPHQITAVVTDALGCHHRPSIQVGVSSRTDLADHNVGDVTLTVTDQGIIGFDTDVTPHQGSGLVYGGANVLYIGSPWLGTSAEYVVNHDFSAEPEQDWTVSSDPDGHLLFGGNLYSDQDGYALATDAGHPHPRGVLLHQNSWAFASTSPPVPEQGGVLMDYLVSDPDNQLGPTAYFGVYLDLDIANSAENQGRVYEPARNRDFGYAAMWHADGPYVGLALFRPPVTANMTLVHNPTFVYPQQHVPDLDKFLFLSAGDQEHVVPASTGPDDWSLLVSAGPFTVPPAGMRMTFGIGVAPTLEELEETLLGLERRFTDIGETAGIALDLAPPRSTRFLGAAPNPFNPSTLIRFELGSQETVRLRVLDARGAVVAGLCDGPFAAGLHAVPWSGRSGRGAAVASGVYFVRFEAGAIEATQKLVLVK
jgi:hypothetical protein